MTPINFLKGFAIGITMAAPIGPISILCIRRSLVRGHHAGIATAIGVALADGLYALIAALGLTAISTFLINKTEMLYVAGGAFLIILGYKAFTAKAITFSQPLKSQGFFVTVIQTMLLTFTNPMTILTFIAAFAALGFKGQNQSLSDAIIISLGVFAGSALWFIMLSTVVAHFRRRVTPSVITIINKLSGSLLIAFGTFFIANAIIHLL